MTRSDRPQQARDMPPANFKRPASRADFDIAIICALEHETDAVEACFDQFWEEDDDVAGYGKAPNDQNTYTTGRIGKHNVVLAYMPTIGKVRAASVAANFRSSFPNIRLGLVVGVCGGVPRPLEGDLIYLGDVIISTSLVQFDLGRQYADRVRRKDTVRDNLHEPIPELGGFLGKLRNMRGRTRLRGLTHKNIGEVLSREEFTSWRYPGAEGDKLFRADFRHKHHLSTDCPTCAKCIKPEDPVCDKVLEDDCNVAGCYAPRPESQYDRVGAEGAGGHTNPPAPMIHFGPIASGDLVIKSSHHRDRIVREEKVIAFEMEGAGVWDNFPTIVIKSACDYADSHKNKVWQKYASVAAAACTKALLSEWRGVDRNQAPASSQRTNVPAGEQTTTIFNNHGPVASQAATQTIHGNAHFAPVYNYASGAGPDYGSQVGFNFGTVNNHDHPHRPS